MLYRGILVAYFIKYMTGFTKKWNIFEVTTEFNVFHCSSFLSSFVILIKDGRTEGIFCLNAAGTGIG